MKHRLKGLLALVLSLTMVFALATNAWAAVQIGNVDMGDGTTPAYYKNGDTSTATGTESDYNAMLWLDGGNLTLTLNGFTYSGTDGIFSDSVLTINLIGDNSVTASNPGGGATAIIVDGYLTIDGTGSLTASGTSRGIYADNVTIESGKVTATGGNYGIGAKEGITISGGVVEAEGDDFGIYVFDPYSSGGTLVISGGTVEAEGGTRATYAGGGVSVDETGYTNGYQWTTDSTGATAMIKSTDTNGFYHYNNSHTYLKIEPITCTVTFDLQDHGTMTTATQTDIPTGETVDKPTDPTEDGWTFGGWYEDAACSNAYDFSSAVHSSFTLYAKWTENSLPAQYTVKFNANGGSGTMNDATDVSGDYTLPANGFTAPAGKEFIGWSVDPAGAERMHPGEQMQITKDTTLYAIWKSTGGNGGQGPSIPVPYPPYNPTPEPEVTAPKTFDSGVALHIGLTILAASGSAWLAKKKD